MPSSVTDVPGSQGPRQSGSVIVPTEVPTQTSTMSLGSHLCRLAGGGLELLLSSSSEDDELCSPAASVLLPEEEPTALPEEVDRRLDTALVPEESAFSKLEGTDDVDCNCDFNTLLDEEEDPLELLPPELALPLPELPPPLPEEVECCWFESFALSLVDGGPGAFGVLLLLLNEGPVLVFDENKLDEVLVLVLF